jgi:hypothetical protein
VRKLLMIRLIVDNETSAPPAPLDWDKVRDNTRLNLTLTKRDLQGLVSAFMQMADATSYAVAALDANAVQRAALVRQSFVEAQSARRIAADVLASVQATAERHAKRAT